MQTQRFKVNSLTYHLLPVCLMLAICFLLFFRGIGETEFYDKQEAREALVIWEIHNSGNWILPLRNGEEIPAKPPFYHWLGAMLSSVVGRVDELSARLPSALLGTLGVLVTYAVGAVLCLLAFFLFWNGNYWLGTLSGFIFMVLDTVDGKLARCTGASSKWGNVFDHGIDLVHPPFWWWAWEHGLTAYGRPLSPIYATMVLWAIIGGYVAQRVIEGIFMRRFGGMHIHVWRPIDSQFRLITARRNPNMVILVAALLLGRPDAGLVGVAWWTIVSLFFHAVRLAQASEQAARGRPIVSWLS